MSDLVAFLTARLDEDEAWAKWAADRSTAEWHPDFTPRHDPARVLREVEAGRGRVTRYQEALQQQGSPGDVAYEWWNGKIVALLQELRADASIYSDHPDYRQEWKP